MSDKSLARIEKAIEKLARSQVEIQARLDRLAARAGGGDAAAGESGNAADEEVIRFLDGFRAAEALGESSLGAWIEVCENACLRGGLRTIRMREGMHAHLLAERLKELGGSPRHEIPEDVQDKVMERLGSREKSDAKKLRKFLKQFGDVEAALQPIHDMAARLDHDPETQALLRTIAQDERATLEFLQEARELLDAD